MRLRSSLFQRLAVGQGGAIMEPGDGEMLLPPVLQPVAVIGGPLSGIGTLSSGAMEQSVLKGHHNFSIGVTAALSNDLVTLASGIWEINLNWRLHFSGTTDGTKTSRLLIADPDGDVEGLMFGGFFSGVQLSDHLKFVISFDRSGWIFRLTRDALIAGDTADVSATIVALKLS